MPGIRIQRREVCSQRLQALARLDDPLLARIFAARAVDHPEQLECGLERLLPTEGLAGIDRAAALLADAVRQRQKILIVGDFDADGATSSALAVRALRAFGAANVDYLVPNRFEFGYGLTPEIVAVAATRAPDLIVTVDNGISSIGGVEAARRHGMRVLVTDHHLAGATLPAADAIVNPNQPGDGFASKNLAGVGVIFYVMLALRVQLRDSGWFAEARLPEPNMGRLLDLVALGTVADVVPLDSNNRILVEQGIRRIRAGQCCAGIQALLQVAGRSMPRLVASDLGFAVGPRLNAAGRLEDMALGIECLLSDDPASASAMAERLDQLNRERRDIEAEMREQALTEIAALQLQPEDAGLPYGVCLYDPGWHQGVIGIVASRIKEHLHRPVIAFAPAGEGQLKGSARSVHGLHIRDALDAVAAHNPGLIDKFGGHAMAAGLSLAADRLEAFKTAFDTEVRRQLSAADLRGVIWSDGELEEDHLCLELAERLRAAGPWGQGFPEPTFDGDFEVVERRVVGERHWKMVVRLRSGSVCVDAIAFNALDRGWPEARDVRLAYRLDVNEYRGICAPQLVIEHIDPL